MVHSRVRNVYVPKFDPRVVITQHDLLLLRSVPYVSVCDGGQNATSRGVMDKANYRPAAPLSCHESTEHNTGYSRQQVGTGLQLSFVHARHSTTAPRKQNILTRQQTALERHQFP
jgi:hypothetical protein